MEVAPSINEILIRTSPGCLCSRMRNMEKMGKSGVIYCLFVAGLFLVIIAKLSMFLCFLLLLGVFYHPPLYNFNCEWDITRSIREVWIKIWIFARTKELIFLVNFRNDLTIFLILILRLFDKSTCSRRFEGLISLRVFESGSYLDLIFEFENKFFGWAS